ncbi:MAG: hypothetical protein NE334_00050 [Lentisphaeraceae bacterium]|nr:hypothetical protein [Lentisphaeraceae bacterium]
MKVLLSIVILSLSLWETQAAEVLKSGFDNNSLQGWVKGKGRWTVTAGVLNGLELPEDKHVAGIGIKADCANSIVEFEFKIEEGKGIFMKLMNQKGKKDTKLRFGVSSNGTVDLRAGSQKQKLFKAVGKSTKISNFSLDKWYKAKIAYLDNSISVSIDSKELIKGQVNASFSGPKNKLNLVVSGKASFKNFKLSKNN